MIREQQEGSVGCWVFVTSVVGKRRPFGANIDKIVVQGAWVLEGEDNLFQVPPGKWMENFVFFWASGSWLVGSTEGSFGGFVGKSGRFNVSKTTNKIINLGFYEREVALRAL